MLTQKKTKWKPLSDIQDNFFSLDFFISPCKFDYISAYTLLLFLIARIT